MGCARQSPDRPLGLLRGPGPDEHPAARRRARGIATHHPARHRSPQRGRNTGVRGLGRLGGFELLDGFTSELLTARHRSPHRNAGGSIKRALVGRRRAAGGSPRCSARTTGRTALPSSRSPGAAWARTVAEPRCSTCSPSESGSRSSARRTPPHPDRPGRSPSRQRHAIRRKPRPVLPAGRPRYPAAPGFAPVTSVTATHRSWAAEASIASHTACTAAPWPNPGLHGASGQPSSRSAAWLPNEEP